MNVEDVKARQTVHRPVRRVPMTLMANLATLRDLGRAYWVHKYDSNWIAKICGDTHIHHCFKKHDNVRQALAQSQGKPRIQSQEKERRGERRGCRVASPAFPAGAGPAALG